MKMNRFKMRINNSILQCPECDRGLVNIGSKVERIHPVAVFINNHSFKIVPIWAVIATLLVFSGVFGGGMSIGYGWIAILFAPSVIMYFLLRVFSIYRITDCPYCGYHFKQRLGRTGSS